MKPRNIGGKKFGRLRKIWNYERKTQTGTAEIFSENGLFKDERVELTMLRVDRADFCPRNPYLDNPEPIGCNATISAPHMVSLSVNKILDGGI